MNVALRPKMPTGGPLADTFGRVHTDLRISVTDRCNLRCVYCMPEEGVERIAREGILRFEEIVRIARVAHSLGVRSIRITGGEPLARHGIVDLVGALAGVGFEDIAMTTNAMLLERHADDLARAGLMRVNVSCDSLRPSHFAEIRRRGDLDAVLTGMDAAEAAGLSPVKVNVVVIAGLNDQEVVDFAAFARSTGRIVRFIEYMPLGAGRPWRRTDVVGADEIVAAIGAVWPLEPAVMDGPAERYRFADGAGEIGVIASVTRPFCGDCNRLRLTADGAIRNCLFSDDERSLRDVMRAGGTDADVEHAIRSAVWAKLPGHAINDPSFLAPRRTMSLIGG